MKKCPSQIQTAEGLGTTHGIDIPANIADWERKILRDLALKVAELAARPIEEEKARMWMSHNDLESIRPLIFCDPENGWNEIITQNQILCKSPLLRVWEMSLRKEIHWAKSLQDDRVIEPYFSVPYHYTNSGYGLEEKVIGGEDGGSFKYDHPIKDYEKDFHKLKFQKITVDYQTTDTVLSMAHQLFDGILEVRLKGVWWWTLGMTWDFIKLRGLENLMIDMVMYPEYVHKMMAFLRDATLHKLDFLEDNGLLGINTGGSYVGSGGFGWTNQLPQVGFNSSKVRTKDMWGFCESQETVGVSPEMVGEFIIPYQKPIMERFGLSCYGCCEPLDPRWHLVKDIKGLRRVSVSPWANVHKMAEYLGKDFIYSRKPSPTPLSDPKPDWKKLRIEMRDFLKATRDCNTEIIMKDNHTLGKNPENASNWCRMVREEIERM